MTALGLEDLGYEDHSPQLVMHYARVGRELEAQEKKLVRSQIVSVEYIERMKKGLNHWVDGGRKGYLAWGIFHFRKQ